MVVSSRVGRPVGRLAATRGCRGWSAPGWPSRFRFRGGRLAGRPSRVVSSPGRSAGSRSVALVGPAGRLCPVGSVVFLRPRCRPAFLALPPLVVEHGREGPENAACCVSRLAGPARPGGPPGGNQGGHTEANQGHLTCGAPRTDNESVKTGFQTQRPIMQTRKATPPADRGRLARAPGYSLWCPDNDRLGLWLFCCALCVVERRFRHGRNQGTSLFMG